VASRSRGRRFAARSLRLAAAHAFAHGLVQIYAECETDNGASPRSLVAAGMRHEGTLRDMHVLGMLPEDLAAAPAFRPA
jgi:RimJ/RimL family protein N-acetyltransferase